MPLLIVNIFCMNKVNITYNLPIGYKAYALTFITLNTKEVKLAIFDSYGSREEWPWNP
jgi:hypothetical protein